MRKLNAKALEEADAAYARGLVKGESIYQRLATAIRTYLETSGAGDVVDRARDLMNARVALWEVHDAKEMPAAHSRLAETDAALTAAVAALGKEVGE